MEVKIRPMLCLQQILQTTKMTLSDMMELFMKEDVLKEDVLNDSVEDCGDDFNGGSSMEDEVKIRPM